MEANLMDIILVPLYHLVDTLFLLYMWVLIGAVIMSWLQAFGVVNNQNKLVATLGEFLFRLTEPALNPIRRMLPSFGGLDISPVILILLIYFIRQVLGRLVVALAGGV